MLNVLWIDDDPRIGDYVGRFLIEQGCALSVAPDGRKGVEAAQRSHHHVIVIDLRLPDMSGLEVLRGLRDAGIGTPAVVLTGYPDVESAGEAARLGAADYRSKPLVGAALLEALREASRRPPFRLASDPTLAAGQPPRALDAATKSVQVHLRLSQSDVTLLKRLAETRGQSLSGAVRYLLRKEVRLRTDDSQA